MANEKKLFRVFMEAASIEPADQPKIQAAWNNAISFFAESAQEVGTATATRTPHVEFGKQTYRGSGSVSPYLTAAFENYALASRFKMTLEDQPIVKEKEATRYPLDIFILDEEKLLLFGD